MRSDVVTTLLAIVAAVSMVPAAVCEASGGRQTRWEEAARKSGLSDVDIAALGEQGVLITDQAYKQVFSAYLSYGTVPFITSDSLLNTYHVLYEESVLRLESAMARRLPGILRRVLDNLEEANAFLRRSKWFDEPTRLSKTRPELVSAAERRARLVMGIGLRLVDDAFRLGEAELDAIVDREVERIVEAAWSGMPEWLGKGDESFLALDYSRYKPRGFYTRSEGLKKYFRAVSWLQSVPFRVGRDEELLAILMLGSAMKHTGSGDYRTVQEAEQFFRAYGSFIGKGDDWDLVVAAQQVGTSMQLALANGELLKIRNELDEMAKRGGGRPQINDQDRLAPADPNAVAEPNFRIISAYRTPSAILFQQTTDLRRFTRPYPDGLEVAVALGSRFARQRLSDPQKAGVLETIDSCEGQFQGRSLYFGYLDALRALLDAPEEDTPDFMKTAIWEAKSCNTALAGWAQLRHTWVLQAKQTVHYRARMQAPRGFVEPEPEFFSRMADLAASSRRLLKQSGAFDPDYAWAIRDLEIFRGVLLTAENERTLRDELQRRARTEGVDPDLMGMLMRLDGQGPETWTEAYLREKAKWVDTVVADIRSGRMDQHAEVATALGRLDVDLEALWERLENVSHRIEVIAHKQLRGVNPNRSEVAFMQDYGKTIAGIMFYGGNSYLVPRDDAPRVVDVYANPDAGGYLHVGVARPRRLYVLYPWKDEAILCQGAVMPYYEFVTGRRVTDESWKGMLDSQERPGLPSWVRPIVSGGRLSKPELRDGY